MNFNIEILTPAILGFLSGTLAPIIVEKWKGKKKETENLILITSNLDNLKESLQHFSADMDKRLSAHEERLRALEMGVSHNSGVLSMATEKKEMVAEG